MTPGGGSPSLPRVRSRLAALALTAAVAVPLVAGCGDEETVVVTVTTRAATSTTPVATTPVTTAPVATDGVTTATDAGAELELRMPSQESVPGLGSGDVRRLPTADDLVNALYTANDPTAATARARLAAAGYEGGVLRDQNADGSGPRLLRVYILRLRDRAAARAEVDASVQEIKATTTFPITDVTLPDADGKGLRIDANNTDILFVTFAAGRDVYGIQSFAQPGGKVYQPEILELSGNLYRAWNTSS